MKIKKHIIATSILLCAFVTINNSCSQAETYEYDKLNRITKIIYDDGSITRYVYDKNGNLKSVISETNEPEVTSTPEPTATPEAVAIPEEYVHYHDDGIERFEIYDIKAVIESNVLALAAVPMISIYNGMRGGDFVQKIRKWIFYIYYPAHIVFLLLVSTV